MKKYKLVTTILLANLLSGCIPMPEIADPCYNASSYKGEQTIYKRMTRGVYLKKSNNEKIISLEINPDSYWLSGRSTIGKFLNAKLILTNDSNQKIVSTCNTLTYQVYSNEDASYSGILPSFHCNDDKLTSNLDNFLRTSNSIKGVLNFDIMSNLDLKKRKKVIAVSRYKKEPYLQSNNTFSIYFDKKVISNYLINGLNHGSDGGSCWNSKPYNEILSFWGGIHFHKLTNTDRKAKTTLLRKPIRRSKLMQLADRVEIDESIRLQAQLSFGKAAGKYNRNMKEILAHKEEVKRDMVENCKKLASKHKNRFSYINSIYDYTLNNCINLSFKELQ